MVNRRDEAGRKRIAGAVEKEISPLALHLSETGRNKITWNYWAEKLDNPDFKYDKVFEEGETQ